MKKKLMRLFSMLLVVLVLFGSGFGVSDVQARKKKDKNKTETAQTETKNTDDFKDHEEHYYFRNKKLLNQHYEKHGIDMGFDDAKAYEEAACCVVYNPDALHKTEAEDGDDIYYVEDTNEFVVVATDGYIRTYFLPDAGIKYYNRQ